MVNRGSSGFWAYRRSGGGSPPTPPYTHVAPSLLPPNRAVVRVADGDGQMIGQLLGKIESVTWRSDGYGMATMLFPPAAQFSYLNLLEFGNRVRIDFQSGLRPWAGVIDVPQELSGGILRVQAYEPAYLLASRLTRRVARFPLESGYGAVAIATLLLSRLEDHPLRVHDEGGFGAPSVEALAMTYTFETVLGALDKLREVDPYFHYHSGGDYQSVAGRIDFQLSLYRGALEDDTERAVLQQGINLADVQVLTQGPIINRVVMASGDADIDGDYELANNETTDQPIYPTDDRYGQAYYLNTAPGVMLAAQVPGDRPRYGRREQFVVLSDLTAGDRLYSLMAHLETRAAALLDRQASPPQRVAGTSLNLSPGLWRNFGVGSLVTLRANGAAGAPIQQEMYVTGMDFAPAAGTLNLVLAESPIVMRLPTP